MRYGSDYTNIFALEGDLYNLELFYTRGCSLHKNICISAAQGGHLNVLKWFRESFAQASDMSLPEQGCEWDSYTYESAIRRGHTKVLEWLINPVWSDDYQGDRSPCPIN